VGVPERGNPSKASVEILGSTVGPGSYISRGDSPYSSGHTVTDQPVVVSLFDPLINHGSGPRVAHVLAQDGCLVSKETRPRFPASGLRDEDGNIILRSILLQHRVAGFLITRFAAPLVHVQTKEVGPLLFFLAAS
jgi:hypothetical protein